MACSVFIISLLTDTRHTTSYPPSCLVILSKVLVRLIPEHHEHKQLAYYSLICKRG